MDFNSHPIISSSSNNNTSTTITDPLQLLSLPDSILEPSILVTLQNYLKSDGVLKDKINNAQNAILSNYHGYGSMANLMLDSLLYLNSSDDEIKIYNNLIDTTLQDLFISGFTNINSEILLKSAEPKWIKPLLTSSSWRSLFSNLCKTHNNIFLNTYIKPLLLSKDDIPVVSFSLSDSFTNFQISFLNHLKSFILEPIKENLERIVTLCLQQEVSYLYAQMVIKCYSNLWLDTMPYPNIVVPLSSLPLLHSLSSYLSSRAFALWNNTGVFALDCLVMQTNILPEVNSSFISGLRGKFLPIDIEKLYQSRKKGKIQGIRWCTIFGLLLDMLINRPVKEVGVHDETAIQLATILSETIEDLNDEQITMKPISEIDSYITKMDAETEDSLDDLFEDDEPELSKSEIPNKVKETTPLLPSVLIIIDVLTSFYHTFHSNSPFVVPDIAGKQFNASQRSTYIANLLSSSPFLSLIIILGLHKFLPKINLKGPYTPYLLHWISSMLQHGSLTSILFNYFVTFLDSAHQALSFPQNKTLAALYIQFLQVESDAVEDFSSKIGNMSRDNLELLLIEFENFSSIDESFKIRIKKLNVRKLKECIKSDYILELLDLNKDI